MARVKRKNKARSWIIITTVWTFFLASGFALFSQVMLQGLRSLYITSLILFFIILVGIIFDIIGTAAAAADEVPLHAKAAKKIYGAKKGIQLVRNAEQVANFCNDMVGDISGIVSGALGAAIIFQLVTEHTWLDKAFLSILLTGLVAALTVGGKAVGKVLAINRSTEIMILVGKVLTKLAECYSVLLIRKLSRKRK